MNNDFIFALEKTKGIGITTINKILNVSSDFNEFFKNEEEILKINKINKTVFNEKLPFSLHLRGDNELLKNKSVAIVGSRKSQEYGNEVAFKIAKFLSNKGYTVVSGMAEGIDTSAHLGVLEGKSSTIAVVVQLIFNCY